MYTFLIIIITICRYNLASSYTAFYVVAQNKGNVTENSMISVPVEQLLFSHSQQQRQQAASSTANLGSDTDIAQQLAKFAKRRSDIFENESYGAQHTKSRKIYLPVQQHPDCNFVGLIVGPRGHTHRKLENESNCSIAIRGAGSHKGGNNATTEPLHVVISGDSDVDLEEAEKKLKAMIDVTTNPASHEHKRTQLRELAEINGK